MDGKIFEKLIEVSECAFFISKPGGEMEITYASKKFYYPIDLAFLILQRTIFYLTPLGKT